MENIGGIPSVVKEPVEESTAVQAPVAKATSYMDQFKTKCVFLRLGRIKFIFCHRCADII